ncbi:hypothetical protein BDW22DRAFT_589856 [Trametopsis cervina]|nr:hypothetical protein BDW22DRAFT_589856 [Trametopsis cervina]
MALTGLALTLLRSAVFAAAFIREPQASMTTLLIIAFMSFMLAQAQHTAAPQTPSRGRAVQSSDALVDIHTCEEMHLH